MNKQPLINMAASVHARPRCIQSNTQGGFTLLAVLVAMLILALAAQGVMTVASKQTERMRLAEQQRVLKSYAIAIKQYTDSTPGSRKMGPLQLEDLLLDTRQVVIKRHLRKIYADPLGQAWVVGRDADGRIVSISVTVPVTAPAPKSL